jgi:hypothetical protein
MAFQAVHRGLLRTGGTATAVTVLSSLIGDRTASRVVSGTVENVGVHKFLQEPRQHAYRLFSSKASTSAEASTAGSSGPSATLHATQGVAAAPPKAASPSFMGWYEGHLQTNPLPTKMVTGGILWSIGDAVGQVVPHVAAGGSIGNDFAYDWPRTGRAGLFGFAVHAPTSHVHFNLLEWMTNRAGFTGLAIPVFKTIMEQVGAH